jgi:YD repeat-containing protein
LLSTTDPLGNTTDFTYDDAGDVLTTTTDVGTSDADGNLLTSTWDWVNPR